MNELKKIIKTYLDNRAKTDTLFAQAYAKPNKSINECVSYIIGEARKQGSAVCIPDDVVFGWAVHYYDEENVEISKLPTGMKASAKATATTDTASLTEADKKKLKKKAEAEYKQQCIDQLRAAEEAKLKKAAERKRERKREAEKSQTTLFEFLGL